MRLGLACLIRSLKVRLRFYPVKVGSKLSSTASDVYTVSSRQPGVLILLLKLDVTKPIAVGLMPLDGFLDAFLK